MAEETRATQQSQRSGGGRPAGDRPSGDRPSFGDRGAPSAASRRAGWRREGGRKYFRRKKVCKFCVEKIEAINYKDVRLLAQFVAESGKIVPRRLTGVCTPHQRRLVPGHQAGAQHRPAAVCRPGCRNDQPRITRILTDQVEVMILTIRVNPWQKNF